MVIYEQICSQMTAKTQEISSNLAPSIIKFGPSSPVDNGCYVTLEASHSENFFVPDETLVESTIQMLKNSRPNDPMFHINWDGCFGSED